MPAVEGENDEHGLHRVPEGVEVPGGVFPFVAGDLALGLPLDTVLLRAVNVVIFCAVFGSHCGVGAVAECSLPHLSGRGCVTELMGAGGPPYYVTQIVFARWC